MEIVDELSDLSPVAAHRFIGGIEGVWRQLGDFPGSGHGHASLSARFRVLAMERWLVIYEAGPAPVEVAAIVDGRRDLRELFV